MVQNSTGPAKRRPGRPFPPGVRYLAAIRSLAVVRRLLRPVAAKVNIGAQQVNVVASAEGDSRPDS